MNNSLSYRVGCGAVAAIVTLTGAACADRPQAEATQTAADLAILWSEAFDAADPSALAALYAEDARSMPPGGPALVGRGEIESYWQDDIGEGGTVTRLTPSDAVAQADLLHVQGAYQVLQDDIALANGQYQQLWNRASGSWQLQHEMWRTDPALQRQSDLADRLTALWTGAYNAADAPALKALYDEDAILATQREGTVAGQEAIESFWSNDFGGGRPSSTLTLTDVYVSGDLAHLEGEYEVSDTGTITEGRYVQLWMREGDAWRIHREMWWR